MLRNLVLNGLDSIGVRRNGEVSLTVESDRTGEASEYYLITIRDNGTGIKPEDLDIIFDPGFSTKFDDDTGDINRGVGLTLVRDLIRDKFHGDITIDSAPGQYAMMSVRLPKELQGGEPQI